MSGPPPITSFELLGERLWHMQQQMDRQTAAQAEMAGRMATHEDIKSIRDTISGLATKDELKALEVKLTNGSLKETFFTIVKVMAGCGVIAASLGLLAEVVHRWDAAKPAATTNGKP